MGTNSIEEAVKSTGETSIPVIQVVSDILRPTLQESDFLQSFVRIGLDEPTDARHTTFADERKLKR